ncbi:MAG: M81 family metallopeptidase [Alphaproteobacteria bacterium]|nr:M81 family metallopeptidase [Alphaproteobacteria bacterium]
MTRIFIAGIFHETHSFSGDRTGLDGFVIHRGDQITARRGDASQVDGFLSVAEREGWEVLPGVIYTGGASGTVDHAVFEQFWRELKPMLQQALAGGLDGIHLSLHGAMVTDACDDPEGELMARIRATPGAEALPLYAVGDLHATLTPRMGALSDGMIFYQECPHTDQFASAVRAAALLARRLRTGIKPRHLVMVTPIVWPPTGTGTRDGPMRALEDAARRLEKEVPGMLAVNIVGGYAFSDVPNAGLSFSVISEGSEADAHAALRELAQIAWDMRAEGAPAEENLETVVRDFKPGGKGPVLLVEPADNIGGGAPGDGTEVMRALLKYDIDGAGVAIADPEAVAALQRITIGQSMTLPIGGKGSPLDPGPVTLEVTLVSRSDGVFELEDKNSHLVGSLGKIINMGPTAVVKHRGLTILLTSRKLPPFDLGQWRSQGINPEELSMVGIKAAVGHRAAWDPIASASHTVSTAGPCMSDVTRLPYTKLRRPVFPLDRLTRDATA